MPWYVIQTYTGEEEKLAEMIRRTLPGEQYGECFVVYHEQLWHRHQQNQIHVLRLFPGYVFLSCSEIGQLFQHLKKLPAMSRILATDGFAFTPLWEEEAEFLLRIMDEDHIVRLTYAATDGKDHVTYLSGPLEKCRGQIRRWKFGKRYAAVRLQVGGQEKEVKLGILLNDDVRRETAYGKVEAPVEVPEKYSIWRKGGTSGMSETDYGCMGSNAQDIKNIQDMQDPPEEENPQKRLPEFSEGDRVFIMDGAFEGNTAVVSHVKKDILRISVHMFGREIQAEIPVEGVKRIESSGGLKAYE